MASHNMVQVFFKQAAWLKLTQLRQMDTIRTKSFFCEQEVCILIGSMSWLLLQLLEILNKLSCLGILSCSVNCSTLGNRGRVFAWFLASTLLLDHVLSQESNSTLVLLLHLPLQHHEWLDRGTHLRFNAFCHAKCVIITASITTIVGTLPGAFDTFSGERRDPMAAELSSEKTSSEMQSFRRHEQITNKRS